jgi:hypothetical protein
MFNRDPYTFMNHDSIPKPILHVITTVLKSWDMPRTDYKYVSMFKPDAVLHVLAEPTRGKEALTKLHDDMINTEEGPVVDLQHYLDRVFVLGGENHEKTEIVFNGTLTNILKDGRRITTDYSSWVVMSKSEENEGELRAEHWRVYSDTSELTEAIGKMLAQRAA